MSICKKSQWQAFSQTLCVVFTCIMFIWSNPMQAQIPAVIPTNNLIGYWPLDSNFQNAYSSSHHGTNSGAVPAIGRGGLGTVGVRFNGVNHFATLPSSVMSQVTGSFTVSFWLRADSLVPNNLGYDPINDRSSSIWNFRFRLMFGQTNFATYSPDSSYMDHINANSQLPRAAGPYPNPDGWVHYVLVYAGTASSGVMRLYYNGQLTGVSATTSLMSGARPINIGRGISPTMPMGYGFFRGTLDEIAIWNRALTAIEIQNIYNSCALAITNQPANQSVAVGNTASFTVIPANANATIQWQIDTSGQWMNLVNAANITGVNSTTLNIANIGRTLNGARFRAFISDASCTGPSQEVLLNVSCTALVLQSPASSTQTVGTNASFTAATLMPGAQFQWQADVGAGFQNLLNFGQYAGVTTSTLIVNNLTRQNNGHRYRCLISYLGCTDTTLAATMNVTCEAIFTSQPADFNGVVGGNANFNVNSAAGATYAWYMNAGFSFNLINNGGQFSGANTANLSISNLNLSNNNTGFICIVSSDGCSDTSALAMLRVTTSTSTVEVNKVAWQVYPNPAKNNFTLDLSDQPKPVLVRISDLAGKVHFEEILHPGKHYYSGGIWSSGLYFIAVGDTYQRLVLQNQ